EEQPVDAPPAQGRLQAEALLDLAQQLLFIADCLRRARRLSRAHRSRQAVELIDRMAAGVRIEADPANEYLASTEGYWAAVEGLADHEGCTHRYLPGQVRGSGRSLLERSPLPDTKLR